MKMLILLLSFVFCANVQASDKICYQKDEKGNLTPASVAAEQALREIIQKKFNDHFNKDPIPPYTSLLAGIMNERGYCQSMVMNVVNQAFEEQAIVFGARDRLDYVAKAIEDTHPLDRQDWDLNQQSFLLNAKHNALLRALRERNKSRQESSIALDAKSNPTLEEQPLETAAEADL
jgi:hypothetical protein